MVRILIVEDDALQALALQQHLEDCGHAVVGSASSADQAIRQAGRMRPDLVLMDVNLRGAGTGIDAAAEIRSRFGIPHIFMSAYSDPAILERAAATGPLGYIAKPYTPREVELVLARAGPRLESHRDT